MNLADIAAIAKEKVKGKGSMNKLKAKFTPKHAEPDADEIGGKPDMDADDKMKAKMRVMMPFGKRSK